MNKKRNNRDIDAEQASLESKHWFKLQDPPIFIDGKNSLPFVKWLAKMKKKMKVDKHLIDTLWRCIAYVMSRVSGTAFSHLEPHAWKNKTGLKQ